MDDEILLNLAKNRLRNLRTKNYNLEQFAVRTILKNVRFYLNSDDQLGQLKSLPGVLRDKILQTLIKRRNIDDSGKTAKIMDLMGIFPYLLSSRTRYIELNGILSFVCPDRIDTLEKATECCVQLLQWIEALAPKVETLIIMKNNPFPEISDPSDKKPLVKLEMLHSLKKLQNLKTLRIDLFRFKKNDLLEMCKNLPNLHYLNIHTFDSGPDPSPEVLTSSFCNVKQLKFNNNHWLAYLCIQHLPHIQIVPFDQSGIFDWRRYMRSVPRISGRQHMYVDLDRNLDCLDEEFEDFPVLFPNVSCLTFILLSEIIVTKNMMLVSALKALRFNEKECAEAVSLPKFDHIRQLNLAIEYNQSELLFFERLLSTYGKNLQTLNLYCECPGLIIDLAIILNNCPMLEKLSLINVCLKTSTLQTEVFTELKELELRYPFVRNEDDTMILSNILSAPKLEKVVLEGAFFNELDLLRLYSLIQKKNILSQLHTFHFYLHCNGNDERFVFLTNILKSACVFLPKLSDFRVGRRMDFDHPLLTCAICKDDNIFDECIRNLISMFDNEK